MEKLSKKRFSVTKDKIENRKSLRKSVKASAKVMPKLRFKEQQYLQKISVKADSEDKWWQIKYVFHPEVNYRVAWDMLMLVFIIEQALSVPYYICFNDNPSPSTADFEFVLNLCFMLDILISFNTGFYSQGELVMQRKLIVKDYIKFWFWMDLIASIPYNWFLGGIFDSQDTSNSNAYKAPRVLRIIRIFRFLKILRLLRLAKLKKILLKIEDYIASNTLANIFVFAKLLATVFFIAHWTACIWFYIGDQGLDTHPVTWITAINLQNKGFFEKYVTSLYWAFTTMSTVGYGDIVPFTVDEKIYAMMTMIMASGVFAFTIGSIGSLVSKANAVENKYREEVVGVNRYMKRKKLPKDLQFRVRRYLDYLWENQKKSKMDEKSILFLLSEPLRDEIYSHIHGIVIKFCKIFDKFEANFISQLSRTLINEMFAPGDTIIEEGELTNKMYFIMNGKIIVYHNYTKSIIKELGEQHYFGEISFFTGNPRCASIKCTDFLDVLSLTRINFNLLVEKFPESEAIIEVLSKSCEKGNFTALGVQCYICEESGHYATKCSSILINLDQEETRGKWLDSKNLKVSKVMGLKSKPNFVRKEKKRNNLNYNSRNVVGVPRSTIKLERNHISLSQVIETPPVLESSTGDSLEQVQLVQIRPVYSELHFNSEPESEGFDRQVEESTRPPAFRLSLIQRKSHDKIVRNNFFNNN